jgi:hypothetical protein
VTEEATVRTMTFVQARRNKVRPAVTRRPPCSNFVDLARRMNISADDAIRQYIDLDRRPPTSAGR